MGPRTLPLLLPALAAVLLGGCGSSGSSASSSSASGATRPASTPTATGTSLPSASAAANACGSLRARLHGVRVRWRIEDPQPASLRGRRPIHLVRRAGHASVAVGTETAARLTSVHAPPQAASTLLGYQARYRRLLASLPGASVGKADGLKLEGRLVALNAEEVRDCFAAIGR